MNDDRFGPRGAGALALTFDIVSAMSRDLFDAYRRGGLHNLLPSVAVRSGKEAIRPWNPPSGKISGGDYTLGIHPVYDYRGTFGPQYKLAFHLGSDRFTAGVKRRVLEGLHEQIASALLAAARANEAVRSILKQGDLNIDALQQEDLAAWLAIHVGRYPRLMSGRRKVRPRRVLALGAPIRNATAPKNSLGCVTAFVRPKDATHDERLHALSAGHVITNHGRAPPDTSVHTYVFDPAEEVGTYDLPRPFAYVPNRRSCAMLRPLVSSQSGEA